MGVRIRRICINASLIIIVLGFSSSCQVKLTGVPLVGVILWDKEIRSLTENFLGLLEGLREEGYQQGLNIRLQVVNAASDRGRAAEAALDLTERQARLLITLGTVPTLVALEASRNTRIPILYSHVGNPEATGLSWPDDPGEVRFTGTSNEVAAAEQMHFLLLAKPKLRRLGILYCTATPAGLATGSALEAEARRRGLETCSIAILDDCPELLHGALEQLISQNTEVLFLPDDPVLVKPKNLRAICEKAAQASLAVVGPSRFCLSYGALMAYHSDPFEIGRQTGRQAARILAGTPLCLVPPEKPKTKRLTVNVKAAHALNLALSRHFLSRAYRLMQ